MKHRAHLKPISLAPSLAQSDTAIKYTTILEIVDILLFIPRQIPFKTSCFENDNCAGTGGTTGGTGGTGGVGGFGGGGGTVL